MLLPTPAQRKRVTDQFGCLLLRGVGFGRRPFRYPVAAASLCLLSSLPWSSEFEAHVMYLAFSPPTFKS